VDQAEWTAPDADGQSTCPRHPDAGAFRPAVGCAGCASDPAPESTAPKIGEGERLCAEAERRGLPDGMLTEDRMWSVWSTATKRAESAARVAVFLRSDLESALAANPHLTVTDAIASMPDLLDYLDLAVKYDAAAAKWMDVSVKAGKQATVSVLQRERAASQERAARSVDRAKGRVN
jgi:hypothetical protein